MLHYKDYVASVYLDETEEVLMGKVEGINDSITFDGKDLRELKQEFAKAVESYIDLCKKIGKQPEKKCSGRISYRTDEQTHRQLANCAESYGISVNAYMDMVLKERIDQELKTHFAKVVGSISNTSNHQHFAGSGFQASARN